MDIKIGSHYGEETLEKYALGQLREEAVPPLEEHLLICESCQERLDEVEQFIRTTRAAASELRAEERGKQRASLSLSWLWTLPKPVWAGAFAAVLVAVVLPYSLQNTRGPASEAVLETSRGGEQSNTAHVKSGAVALVIDASELPSQKEYRLDVVDSSGASIWSGSVQPMGNRLRAQVAKPLAHGVYWVRIYAGDSSLLREFGLTVD